MEFLISMHVLKPICETALALFKQAWLFPQFLSQLFRR
jgi:hypothetical protein